LKLLLRNAFSLVLVAGLAVLPKIVDKLNHPPPPAEPEQVYELELSGSSFFLLSSLLAPSLFGS